MTFDGLFKTIENQNLRFTRVDQFNDPLDNSPFLAPLDWKEYVENEPNFINVLKSYMFSEVFSSIFISCFCKEYDSMDSYLMWAHYGQSHTQLCFEIDFEKYNFLGGPSEVNYPESLATFREKLKRKNQNKIGLELVTTKSKVWCYEKEVRLIIDILNPSTDVTKYSASTNGHYLFVPFDLHYISKVIFGVNSSKLNEVKTIKMLKDKGLRPQFEKMIINPETLRLQSLKYKESPATNKGE